MADLVAIGGLNLDFIVRRDATNAEVLRGVELESERQVDAARIAHLLRSLDSSTVQRVLGGSAFNAAQAVAATSAGLAVAYVGVAGAAPSAAGLDILSEVRASGIITGLIRRSPNIAGQCLAVVDGARRGLETCPGANTELANHLEQARDRIDAALGAARMVHVTSVFDDRTATLLLAALTRANAANPRLSISFDPGHFLCRDSRALVIDFARLTDHLFLSDREFRLLARTDQVSIETVRLLLDQLGTSDLLLIVKEADGIHAFRRTGKKIAHRHFSQEKLSADRIVNSTGAGDVCAAGFLCGALVEGFDLTRAALLSARMVRAKLTSPESDLRRIGFANIYAALATETGRPGSAR